MPTPLIAWTTRPFRRRPPHDALRRVAVPVPTPEDTTDAIFLMLRRLRGPLITLMAIFAITVLGLSLMPGVDAVDVPSHMTLFDAFYVMSYTATTIGFGELPHTFSTAQRLWMTFSIYLTVTGWAYSVGTVFALVQDTPFRRALTLQRFRRKVQRLREPFYLVVGYGQAGRSLSLSLDRSGQRLVIVDEDPARIDIVTTDELVSDVPAITADPRNPAVLGLAGLGHPQLQGVLAMTDKDEMNLAVVMSAHLFRPDVVVITRCSQRANIERLDDFGPDAIINPFDRYGSYLVLALNRPVTYRLASWLLREPGSELPAPVQPRLARGRWVVVSDSDFGTEVARDLEGAGLDVTLVDPAPGVPDLTGVVGLVAGAEADTTNLSIAASARSNNPHIYLSVRQKSVHTSPLVRSLAPDSVFVATDIVASEALARVEAPRFWSFIEHVMDQDDDWSTRVLHELVDRVGTRTPAASAVLLDAHMAPAVTRWLNLEHPLTLGALLSDPDDRDTPLAAFATELVRDGTTTYAPDPATLLRPGDEVALLVGESALTLLHGTLSSDAAVEYLATGRDVPSTWVGRALARPRNQSR